MALPLLTIALALKGTGCRAGVGVAAFMLPMTVVFGSPKATEAADKEKAPASSPASAAPASPTKEGESVEAPEQAVAAQVLYCHDGDTCRVRVGGLWMNVRLAGIDAPELASKRRRKGRAGDAGQTGAEAAREALNRQVKGRAVTLRQVDLDHYNRPVAEILLDGVSINLKMVQEGYAEAYRGRTKRLDRAAYAAAEEAARKARAGIWADPHYVSPAEYREKRKGGR